MKKISTFNMIVIFISIMTGFIIANISYESVSDNSATSSLERLANAFDYYNERRF